MTAKGYFTTSDVEAFLGLTFSADQTAHCATLIEPVETLVDGETGRGWLVGDQANEAHYVCSANVWLTFAPVETITVITGRCNVGEPETAMVADVDFEIMNLGSGHVRLINPTAHDRILVSYTPVDTVPADIVRACVEIAASWMQSHLNPGSFGVDSYSLPDLTVRYARSHVQQPIPPLAMLTLGRYKENTHA